MVQSCGEIFKLANEREFFQLLDIDQHYFACRYLGSQIGFLMDKTVFKKHIAKGKIISFTDSSLAV